MATADGEAKILDFGLAKPLSSDLLDANLTSDGEVVDTARSMSPEQVMGWTVDPRSDLFSLGILLYEMLTGISPFRGETLFITLDRVCRYDPLPVARLRPELPDELSAFIERLLAKGPNERPRTARKVIAALTALTEERVTEEPLEPASALADGRSGSFQGAAPAVVATAAQAALAVAPIDHTSAERRRPSAVSPAGLSHQQGERRQVTVICCDLLGSDWPDHDGFRRRRRLPGGLGSDAISSRASCTGSAPAIRRSSRRWSPGSRR